jgi:hypothetical protein
MKLRGLLISAVVLAALVIVLRFYQPKSAADKTAPSENSPKILALKETDIVKIEIKKKSGDEIVLARNAAGKWEMTGPKALPADQEAASSLITSVASLNSDRLVEEKAGDLNPYGLTAPAAEVTVTNKDGKVTRLLMGDDTPAGGGAVYVKLDSDPRVFTIASYSKTGILKTPEDLRDKRLLTVDSDKISRVELNVQTKGKAQTIEFGRNKDEWSILKPKPLRADNLLVGELVRKVQDAKMDTAVSADDAKKAASAFASGTPVATIKLTDASKTQELQVRKSKDDYYAKSNAVEGVYKVSSDLGSGLDKGLDDYRNKKLFDFGFSEPAKIEMHDGLKAYLFTKSGEDWSSSGKKMDPTSVQSFIDKLRDLSAGKFVDSGFTNAAIDVTVTSTDGKRVEKVLISKSGDKYVAKRENEPSLYELESKTVTDLATAANDVKPAPPVAPKAK